MTERTPRGFRSVAIESVKVKGAESDDAFMLAVKIDPPRAVFRAAPRPE